MKRKEVNVIDEFLELYGDPKIEQQVLEEAEYLRKAITHDRLLNAGFELVHTGSHNVYELTNPEAEGLTLDTSIKVGEYKDPNSPFKYWMVNGPYQLPDLKEDRWDLLVRSVKNCIGIDLNNK